MIGLLVCMACTKPVDQEAEKKSITKLIDDETKFAASGDSANWKPRAGSIAVTPCLHLHQQIALNCSRDRIPLPP